MQSRAGAGPSLRLGLILAGRECTGAGVGLLLPEPNGSIPFSREFHLGPPTAPVGLSWDAVG